MCPPKPLPRGVGLWPVQRLLAHLVILWRLLRRWRGEVPYGYGLLHDDLVLAPVLISRLGHFVPEMRYECVAVGVYPFVLPAAYPSSTPGVQVDIHAPVVLLVS